MCSKQSGRSPGVKEVWGTKTPGGEIGSNLYLSRRLLISRCCSFHGEARSINSTHRQGLQLVCREGRGMPAASTVTAAAGCLHGPTADGIREHLRAAILVNSAGCCRAKVEETVHHLNGLQHHQSSEWVKPVYRKRYHSLVNCTISTPTILPHHPSTALSLSNASLSAFTTSQSRNSSSTRPRARSTIFVLLMGRRELRVLPFCPATSTCSPCCTSWRMQEGRLRAFVLAGRSCLPQLT